MWACLVSSVQCASHLSSHFDPLCIWDPEDTSWSCWHKSLTQTQWKSFGAERQSLKGPVLWLSRDSVKQNVLCQSFMLTLKERDTLDHQVFILCGRNWYLNQRFVTPGRIYRAPYWNRKVLQENTSSCQVIGQMKNRVWGECWLTPDS